MYTQPPRDDCNKDASACRLVSTGVRISTKRKLGEEFERRQQTGSLMAVYYDDERLVLVPDCEIAGDYTYEAAPGEAEVWTSADSTFLRNEGPGLRTTSRSKHVEVRPVGRSVVAEAPRNPNTQACGVASHYVSELVFTEQLGVPYPAALRLEPIPPPKSKSRKRAKVDGDEVAKAVFGLAGFGALLALCAVTGVCPESE